MGSRSSGKAAARRRRTARPAAEDPQPEEQFDDDLLPILEAMLFAAHEALPASRLARALGGVAAPRVMKALQKLEEVLEERRSPLQLVEMAGGFRLVTRPEYAPYLGRLLHRAERERLSPAALETLAIVAYRQPVTRADIEGIRGVQAGPVLRMLQERRLVKVVGRAPIVGRPLQYGTTRKFLDTFGLNTLRDLPEVLRQDGSWSDGSAPDEPGEVAAADLGADGPESLPDPAFGDPDPEESAGGDSQV